MIELSYQVTEDEFLEAGFEQAKRKGTIQVLKASTIIFVGIYALLGIYMLNFGRAMHDTGWTMVGVFILGIAVAFPFIKRNRLQKALQKLLRNNYQGAPFMHSPVQARMDDSGIFMQYISGSSVNTWEGHQSSFETNNLIVVMQTTTHMRVFPKRAFTANQLAEFRQLLGVHSLSPKP
jgi:F0F1-type ATP synthase assembly protein I